MTNGLLRSETSIILLISQKDRYLFLNNGSTHICLPLMKTHKVVIFHDYSRLSDFQEKSSRSIFPLSCNVRGCTLLKKTKIDLFILWLNNYIRPTPKIIWKPYTVQSTAIMPFRKAKFSHQRQKK